MSKLKYLLQQKNITPKMIIEATGWSKRKVSEIINGTHWIKPSEAEILAKLLNMAVEDLYDYLSR